MSADVVVVDDQLSAAQEFERLVAARTGLRVVSTDDPDHALEVVKVGDVAVAVLDERMPKKSGTVLFAEMRGVDPHIRGIMLTGEASADEAGRAVAGGYSDYLHKRDVASLGERVLAQYVSHQAAMAAQSISAGPMLASEVHGKWPVRRYRVEYRLQDISIVETEIVHQDSWETALTLTAGETRTDTIRTEDYEEFHLDQESVERLCGDIGLSAGALSAIRAGLEAEITERHQMRRVRRSTTTVNSEASYKLPPEPGNIEQVHVRTRHYQRAPTWSLARATIRRDCGCCRSSTFFIVSMYCRSDCIATQHIDYCSDGTIKIINTGVVRRAD